MVRLILSLSLYSLPLSLFSLVILSLVIFFFSLSLSLFQSLGGTLSSRLGSFTRLNRLVISGSQVSGEIPDEIGELGNLRELVLSRSRVSGRFSLLASRLLAMEITSVASESQGELSPTIPSHSFFFLLSREEKEKEKREPSA